MTFEKAFVYLDRANPARWDYAKSARKLKSTERQTRFSVSGIALLLVLSLPLGVSVVNADEVETDVKLAETQRFDDGDSDNGARLYKRYCRGCHGKDGRGGAHTFMPHVENLTKKEYIEKIPDGFLYTVIAEGGEAVGKNSYMPAWKTTFSVQEIKDVISFIRTLPTY